MHRAVHLVTHRFAGRDVCHRADFFSLAFREGLACAYPPVGSLSRGVGESRGFYERNDAGDATSLASGRSCECSYTATRATTVWPDARLCVRSRAKEPMLHDTFSPIDVNPAPAPEGRGGGGGPRLNSLEETRRFVPRKIRDEERPIRRKLRA